MAIDRRPGRALIALVIAFIGGGCECTDWFLLDEAPARTVEAAPVAPKPQAQTVVNPTWYRDVLPVMTRRCLSCHSESGVAPFGFSYKEAREKLNELEEAIRTGYMPPWLPSDDCQRFSDPRRLPKAEARILLDWVAAGGPEGDPNDAPIRLPSPDPIRFNVALFKAQRYIPTVDESRCFAYDLELAEERFVTAFEITPGRPQIVKSVVLFAIDPAEALRLSKGASGWSCPAEPLATRRLLGVWAPGEQVTQYPRGSGVPVGARQWLVARVTYQPSGSTPEADQTSVKLKFSPEPVASRGTLITIGKSPFAIPPRAAGFTLSASLRLKRSGTLRGLMPYMRGYGRRIEVRSKDSCLINIPFWEYALHHFYFLDAPNAVELHAGDELKITCAWNNPTVAKVHSGEGPNAERCLAYLYLTEQE